MKPHRPFKSVCSIESITLEIPPGASLSDISVEAMCIANKTGYTVTFKFNGATCTFEPAPAITSSVSTLKL